ncbi:MAG: NTE family protein [Pseudohongiellaceae bacterium]|jgi:NTE family protein
MMTAGLILTGGGARAAYQAGVLKAISDQFPGFDYPFPIICGSSAGALNAVGIGAGGEIFRHSIEQVESLWLHLTSKDVYHSDYWSLAKNMGQFVKGFVSGDGIDIPGSMFDCSPLRKLLESELDFNQLNHNIQHHDIKAIAVTCCGYRSGQSVSFFQGEAGLDGWESGQRLGVRTQLTLDHLMASSAIPSIFPPVKINREYFGDGVARNMAPLSPAVHLGADRILVVGVSANTTTRHIRKECKNQPKLPHILEQVINGMFIDTVENDVEKVSIINALLKKSAKPEQVSEALGLRFIETLVINPSVPIDELAIKHIHRLPAAVRAFFGLNREPVEGGVSLASYLLFEGEFLRDLISLGYRDAKKKAKEIEIFFNHENS